MTSRILIILTVVCFSLSVAEARTWKPAGRRAIVGEFDGVSGSDVRIRTNTGVETVPYMKLPRNDKAVVKSNLISQGKQSEASRLNELEKAGEGGSGSGDMMDMNKNPLEDSTRTWTDINGNQIEAEYVGVVGSSVQLRSGEGQVRAFPVSGFVAEDRAYISEKSGIDFSTGAAASAPGAGQPGMAEGGSSLMPESPGMAGPPAGLPGFPGGGMPNMPSLPNMPNMPGRGMGPGMMPGGGGFPGMRPGGVMPPGMPDSSGFPNASMPGSSMPGSSFPGSSFPGSSAPGSSMPDSSTGFPSSMPGTGMPPMGESMPGMQEPSIPDNSAPSFPEPSFPNVPQVNGPQFEWVFKCDQCGAEFKEGDGVKQGDPCPKCSGGFSFRGGRGTIKGIIALLSLAAAGVGWVIKKSTGK